jgi:glycosyltransferase involved in cell wall biosynthesis
VIPKNKSCILFVAHVPPPLSGQGAIHQLLLQGEYSDVTLVHLPMLFSKDSSAQGKISLQKIAALVKLVVRTYHARIRRGVRFLYFSPGGPTPSAVIRDCIYLLAVRPIMCAEMLVFHSSGVAEYIERMPPLIRAVLRSGFSRAQLAVQLSANAPPDGLLMHAHATRIISNSVPDEAGAWFRRMPSDVLRILYVGLITRGKGIQDLLLAARDLSENGIKFALTLVGSFRSLREEQELREIAASLPDGSVEFLGPLSGEAKRSVFRANDVFCFPSFWHAETFPLVLLEALSFGMPIVASRWRGIPDLLGQDNSCGTLVDVHSIRQISLALRCLAADSEFRDRQSRQARLRYEERFRVDRFFASYDSAFSALVESPNRTSHHSHKCSSLMAFRPGLESSDHCGTK